MSRSPDGLAKEGLDRRQTLQCLGWAGTGALFAMSGGVARSTTLDRATTAPAAPLSFVQISDTHLGFGKAANPDTTATLRETIGRIKMLPRKPDFVVHTGDITHLATPQQFDLAQQVFSELGVPVFAIPGEHDIVDGSDPRPFLARFGKDAKGDGWYSFDIGGTHFVALNNALVLGDMGMGTLGRAQLDWLKADLAPLPASTPIVALSHFPLWSLQPAWGWGTVDAAEALALLARFGSVTSLNGHVHQLQTRVEGKVRFHAARSTAYPQPAPGVGAGPGPLVVPPEQLRGAIGFSSLEVVAVDAPIAITDTSLA
ncbi:metallophosphoesterase [Caulobacter sp.]|uniref:metallophosphoesterase family protein n=1 Tax=Caulobacter sp. TaxID=78 RepID=UPI001B0BCAE6|nr:metallophosphoesterase [Caulobacter sp.]MBO9545966.1 metallophosphoesterase [Caulobacter sp.]